MSELKKKDNMSQLRELASQLDNVESDLSVFFKNIPVLFFTADKVGNLTKINKAWTDYLGWTEEELTSQTWLSFVHPEDLVKTVEASDIMKDTELHGFVNRYRCKDGSYKRIQWYASTWIKNKNYGIAIQLD